MENVKTELFTLFGTGELNLLYESFGLASYEYTNEKFHIEVVNKGEHNLIVVDLHSCFNKTGQCPLCFILNENKILSNRKRKRIVSAINFFLRNEKEAGTYFSGLPGYDDLDQTNRSKFYAMTN